MEGLVYLASPYSHLLREIQEARFRATAIAAARLMSRGVMVFSPIAHCHPLAMAGGLPGDWEFWKRYCLATLTPCRQLWVLKLPGWEDSKGIAGEVQEATRQGKPIYYLEPTINEREAAEDWAS